MAENHPAYGMIGASRGSYGGEGTALFASDIHHRNTVTLRISGASRSRDLHHDWTMGVGMVVEVEMSEAQWASFVSTMNVGDGVPCTIRYRDGKPMPPVPYEPQLAKTMAETQEAAGAAFDKIKEAMAAYEATLDAKASARSRKDALRNLHFAIENAVPKVNFAGKQLVKQTEDVVNKARSDIEAFVTAKAAQLHLDRDELGASDVLEIES